MLGRHWFCGMSVPSDSFPMPTIGSMQHLSRLSKVLTWYRQVHIALRIAFRDSRLLCWIGMMMLRTWRRCPDRYGVRTSESTNLDRSRAFRPPEPQWSGLGRRTEANWRNWISLAPVDYLVPSVVSGSTWNRPISIRHEFNEITTRQGKIPMGLDIGVCKYTIALLSCNLHVWVAATVLTWCCQWLETWSLKLQRCFTCVSDESQGKELLT